MDNKKIHKNIEISGKVQGVFFRISVAQKARELGISGFVKNQSNGAVRLEIEGGKQAVKEMVAWCQKGPPLAKVKKVEVFPGELKGFNKFVIDKLS